MPKLSKAQIAKVIKKYAIRFVPKYRAFNILQNNIEDVVKKTIQMWKITDGLATIREGENNPIKVKDDKEDEKNEDTIEGGTKMNVDSQETTEEEQQQEQSVQDTHFQNVNPQQKISVNIETIRVKDVSDSTTQKINPLIEEELKKILDLSTLQAKLWDNPILVSVEEIQKSMTNSTREEVKTQELPTITPQVTNVP